MKEKEWGKTVGKCMRDGLVADFSACDFVLKRLNENEREDDGGT
jgi:hypothetical protein